MRNNLKLVAGTSMRPVARTDLEPEYSTTTTAVSIGRLIGDDVLSGRPAGEYWRDYALYHQNVRSVPRLTRVFFECLGKWKSETEFTSSMTDIVLHPAYQRIIGLGPDVVPFVLQELAEHGGHWYWALQALTGENPVPLEDQGRPTRMTAAWVEWGLAHSLI